MASPVTKPAAETGAESPTTARPFEMDDDDAQETGIIGEDGSTMATPTAPAAASTRPEESTGSPPPPPKPPRRQTEAQQNETILREAFPTVDQAVIRAVLRASGGQVEPAFNALLEMTDPNAVKNEPEDVPPPQPRRPQGRAEMRQMEADELFARQLAEHYENVGAYEDGTSNRPREARRPQGLSGEEREHSFLDDDLPVIRENLRKGFIETQTKVNGWITNLKKKIEENFDETEEAAPSQGQPPRRHGEASRRCGDYDRYDADPQVLSDDFAGMKFSADGAPANRPGNTSPYKPALRSSPPKSSDRRRVGFKDGHEDINMYDASPTIPPKDTAPTSGSKASKWQPLSTVEPSPVADNDPFSLGDSEDEKDAKDKPKDAKAGDRRGIEEGCGGSHSRHPGDLGEEGRVWG